jgi:hypothetical protein
MERERRMEGPRRAAEEKQKSPTRLPRPAAARSVLIVTRHPQPHTHITGYRLIPSMHAWRRGRHRERRAGVKGTCVLHRRTLLSVLCRHVRSIASPVDGAAAAAGRPARCAASSGAARAASLLCRHETMASTTSSNLPRRLWSASSMRPEANSQQTQLARRAQLDAHSWHEPGLRPGPGRVLT